VVSQTSGTNLASLVHAFFIYLEFDLTLGVIHSDLVATSCSPIFIYAL
jgi:hypothetical protein